jgi:transcriptional regulator with XRE-family HTH domain
MGNMSPAQEQSLRSRFAENLRIHRTVKGISQEALADRAKLHRTFVSEVEREIRNLSIDNIEKLAKALEVDPVELFKPIKP